MNQEIIEESASKVGISLRDVYAILRRRRKVFFWVFLGVFAIFIALVLYLPAKYRSTAKILIEKQGISPELIQTSVASFAEQEVQRVAQRVMTRANLGQVIEKFGLYPKELKTKTREELIEKMRDDIDIQFINAEMSDPRMGKAIQIMLAFDLSYQYPDPKIAQQVLSELVSLFLNENAKARTQTASDAVRFLDEESRRLKSEMMELQARLAKFKEENLDRLPEVANLYRDELNRIENQLLQLDAQERALQDRIFYLKGQLLQIEPYAMAFSPEGKRVLTVHDRLKALRSEYPSLVARYSEKHPEVLRIKKEIESLEREVGQEDDLQTLHRTLQDKKSQLAASRKRYSEQHPDIVKLSREVEQLQAELVRLEASPQKNSGLQADNPAYITLQAQLKAAEEELQSLTKTREKLRQRQTELRANLAASPLAEKEYRMLLEDLDATSQRYRDIRARQLQAKVSEQFEVEGKSERLTLIDPPNIPEEPAFPNRPLFLLIGAVLSFGLGAAAVILAELLDASIRDERVVLATLGTYPLATIPYIPSSAELVLPSRSKQMAWVLGIVGLLAALLIILHFWLFPLDVLWFRLLRKIP